MKNLRDILYKAGVNATKGSLDLEISKPRMDSRQVGDSDLFIAFRGVNVDGHSFINKAIANGASAIICEEFPDQILDTVTYISVNDGREALAAIAANYYDNPSKQIKVVGITGTNGKTTSATLLYKLFISLGYKVALISTIDIRIAKRIIPSTHTTPDPLSLQGIFREIADSGCSHCFMEVSSHAVEQKRINGINFQGAVFTNITRDHLDYHKTFKNYISAKKTFFDSLTTEAFALVNADDKNGLIMIQNCKAKKYTYAQKRSADFKTKILENTFEGLVLNIDGNEVYSKFIGSFNAYNLLLTYSVALLLGEDKIEVLTALSNLESVEGRFEQVYSDLNKFGIVDYAHTPDALKNVLQTINKIKNPGQSVITVLGCGGERDKGKRPLMAKIATEMSTKVVFTSDNPRSENPDDILTDMIAGVELNNKRKVLSISDRKEAIRTAVMLAGESDIVLVAGKGHEKYQEIKGEKFPFDDKAVLQKALK